MALLCIIAIYNDKALAEDLIYYGKTGGSGDPGITSSLKNEYSKIDVRITGVPDDLWSSTKTTEALPINSNKKLTVKGKNTSVTIINTVQSPKIDNNGGIYAKGNSSFTFTEEASVYIASIAGSEKGNSSTAITAKQPITWPPSEWQKKYTNKVYINGENVKIIGSLDVGVADLTNSRTA